MGQTLSPKVTREMAQMRGELAPEIDAAFRQFSQAVFEQGALSRKTKQLIAVAVAHSALALDTCNAMEAKINPTPKPDRD